MIHDGDRASEHMVLFMTNQTILFGFMKTDFLPDAFPDVEGMALKALPGRHTFPRLVARRTVLDILVKDTQRTGLGGCIIEKQPRSKRYHDKNTHHLIRVFHRNHLNP